MVTRPAVPPYSSITIATCERICCISRSRSVAGLESGTNTAGRITAPTSSDSESRLMWVRRTRSLR